MEVETATIVGFRVEMIAIHAAKNARLVVTDRCPAEKCTYERVEHDVAKLYCGQRVLRYD